ncbi:MutS-related protein [Tellurirhabdus bombi]|uniref:MutS-related protein n=1 Tax=Tellurirhabdus bombi TaxID=2907205 RepID=UPI001F47F098|nr:DNA mismatch repair protein MutS [Tellurirhabdus bombi]
MSLNPTFSARQQQFSEFKQAAQQRYNQLAILRLVWFVGVLILLYVFYKQDQISWLILTGLVGIAGFLALLKRHQKIQQERDRYHWLAYINEDEAARLERKFNRPETGADYLEPTHPYAGDLDVFGKHSLFRLLNRTHTQEGERKLATYLLYPAPEDAIVLRQAAAAELQPQLDWRQDFEALAYLNENVGQPSDELKKWAKQPELPIPGYAQILRWVFPLITVTLIGFWLSDLVPGWAVAASLLLHGILLSRVAEQTKQVSEQTFSISRSLRTYRDLFRHVSDLKVEAAILQRLKLRLETDHTTAAEAIGQLGKLVENLNYRRNPYFFLFFGLISLWDIHYLVALESWKKKHGPQLANWIDALAEWEAINSLSGFAYAHPTYIVPAVRENELHVEATQARHPLLPPTKSVANSLAIEGNGQTVLITGSNMSGKSTFLRTIGTNTILALSGAVVAAERFGCSPVQVFTSMRTQDSLEESTSSFYAELKRLRALIERTRQAQGYPVFYFLDEILKGTNSADRHQGAKALILQLHQTTASGFVSTHDVELGELAETHDFIHNYSFHSDVVDGQLHFDYTLREGVCRSFNASQLMRSIGIDMELGQAQK